MSVSFNRVILAGNITRDPELRFTKDGVAVVNFGLAVNDKRSKKKEDAVDFFDVTAWRELGETIANYKKKGDPVVAHNVQFLLAASGKGQSSGSSSGGQSPHQQRDVAEEDFDDDLPF
jgi:single-strand DNA-binding protein